MKDEIKKTIESLKKDDSLRRLVLRINKSGLIGDSYTEELLSSIKSKNTNLQYRLNQLMKRMRTWDVMTNKEKRMFTVSNINKIMVDVEQKKIVEVTFK